MSSQQGQTEQRVHSKTDRATSSQQNIQSTEFTARTDRAMSSQQGQTEQRVDSKDRQRNEFTARIDRNEFR